MTNHRMLKTVLAVLSVCGASAAWAGSVTSEQMDAASLLLVFDGYTQSQKDRVDSLFEDDKDVLTYDLQKGKRYRFVGVCDEDCRDLDLEAYDKDGNVIGIDYSTDDIPVVEFKAPYTGKYKIHVSLEHCSTWACSYRVRGFSKAF